MIAYMGLMASFLFIIATFSQVLKVVRDGHAKGLSYSLIWLLNVGFLLMLTYVIDHIGFDLALLSTYFLQLIGWIIIAKYKHFERELK